MGSTIKSINQKPNGPIKTDTEQPNDRNSNTEQTEKRKRGRPRKSAGGAAAAAAAEEVVPRLVNVEVPEPAPLEQKAAAPKKPPRKKAAAKSHNFTADNVAALLKTSFDIIGNREGLELWKLDDRECEQLSEPLAKIISRSSYMEKITDEYGDYIALIIAMGMIIIPRLMMQLKQNKEKNKNDLEKKREKKLNDERTDNRTRTDEYENRTLRTSDKPINESAPVGVEATYSKFHESLPFIQL